MLISTHLRFAAGICLLTTGLLIGSAGGGIAAADTDSSSSSSSSDSGSSGGSSSTSVASQGAGSTSQTASVAGSPAASVAENLRKTLRDSIQNTLNALGRPGRQSGVANTPVTKPDTTASEDEKTAMKGADPTSGDTTPLASKSEEVASNSKAGGSDSAALDAKTSTSASNDLPALDRAEAVRKVVDPVTNAVVTVATVALAVPGVIAALPTSPDPFADVITSLQVMLTTVGDAVVPLATKLPSDVYNLLVVLADRPAAGGVVRDSGASGSFTSVAAPGLDSPVPPQGPRPVYPTVLSLGNGAAPVVHAEIQTAALQHDFSLSGTTPLAPERTKPRDVKSFLDHTVNAILLPASLSALAAFALPGVAGLLIACAAGMRLGYRQAKAAMAARNSGIARFAGTGPLGIVRSGSLVALRRPRGSRAGYRKPSRTSRHLRQVA